MRKRNIGLGRIVLVTLLLILIVFAVMLYIKLVEFHNQLVYLQDTTNVILTDVSGLEEGIAKSMQRETGRIEDYSIEFLGLDLNTQTYDVAIQVIPKEYTDNTKVSVFFGTLECRLNKENYVFQGVMSLPLDQSFHSNLTFLLMDGKKRKTEIYSDYSGIDTKLDQVLTASFPGEASMADGAFKVKGHLSCALDGVGLYEFLSMELVMTQEGKEIYVKEYEDVRQGMRGEEEIEISIPLEEAGNVRVFLRAQTTKGYRFEYQLMEASLTAENTGEDASAALQLEEDSVNWDPVGTVYDAKGYKKIIE